MDPLVVQLFWLLRDCRAPPGGMNKQFVSQIVRFIIIFLFEYGEKKAQSYRNCTGNKNKTVQHILRWEPFSNYFHPSAPHWPAQGATG